MSTRNAASFDSDALIARIYDAAVEAETWEGVIAEIRDALRCRSFALFFQKDGVAHFNAAASLDRAVERAFEERYAAINPWARGFLTKPVGEVVLGQDILSVAALERTEFYADFLRPNGLSDGIGLILSRGGDGFLILSGLRGREFGAFTMADRDALRRIAPHLRRAADIALRLDGALRVGNGLQSGLQSLAIATLLVDAECRLLFANSVGENVLERGAGTPFAERSAVGGDDRSI